MRWRLLRDEHGLAAVEFGILGPIFFALLAVLLDLSLFFTTRAIVDDAVQNGARAVRVGALTANDGGASFRAALCADIYFLSCDKFSFSVQSQAHLVTTDFTPTVGSDGTITGAVYQPGGPSDVVVVTIVYVHRFIFPYVGGMFGDDGLDDPFERAIISHLVVKNEPFPSAGGGGP